MSAINSAYVNQHSRKFAKRGMRVEGTSEVAPGTVLHRFVLRADVPDQQYLANPWWFQTSAVRKILEAAREGHRGDSTASGQAARAAGLSENWRKNEDASKQSGSLYLLTAKMFAPLTIFWGAPRPIGTYGADSNDVKGLQSGRDITEIEIVPDPRCVQFFIPGMHEIAPKAASVISKTKLEHSSELSSGEVELFLRIASGAD